MNSDDPKPAILQRWKGLLILLLVFAMGAASGGAGALFYMRAQVRQAVLRAFAGRDRTDRLERLAVRVENNLASSLALNAQERQAVHEELQESVRQGRRLRLRMLMEVRRLVADTVVRIGQRLPPDKQAKLKAKADRRLDRWGLEPDPGK